MATWLPIVPERTRRAEGLEVREAMKDSRALVVGSSRKTCSLFQGEVSEVEELRGPWNYIFIVSRPECLIL